MVALLRRLDVIEKAPIGRRLPRSSDWGKKDKCAGRVRSWNGFTPLLQPCARTAPMASLGTRSKKAGRSSKGWPTPLSPQSSNVRFPSVAAKIALLVEVAMDQRVSKAASRHLIEPTGESAHKTRE